MGDGKSRGNGEVNWFSSSIVEADNPGNRLEIVFLSSGLGGQNNSGGSVI